MRKIILFAMLVFMSFTSFAITDKQKSDLLFMYQEEKLARDVYVKFWELYKTPIFDDISKAKSTQVTQIKILLDVYKITVPVLEKGKFTDKTLQGLYTKIIKEGKSSKAKALKAGITLEEKSIADLNEKIIDVPNDIKLTYQNILLGNEKHKKNLENSN